MMEKEILECTKVSEELEIKILKEKEDIKIMVRQIETMKQEFWNIKENLIKQ